MSVGPAPTWVIPAKDDVGAATGDPASTDAVEYRLIDDQVRLGEGPKERFFHRIYRVRNEQGIPEASEIRLDFDPAYETVVLHAVDVRRDGTQLARLHEDQLHILQRESNLDAHVYDQRKTVVLFLEDVRVGDVIESSYTVFGENPVFGGRDTERWTFAWSDPVKKCAYRLVAPRDRLARGSSHGAPPPVVTGDGTLQEMRWELRDVAAIQPDPDVPAWFEAYPSHEQTDFDGWADVARWASEMFVPPEVPSAELRERIDSIRTAGSTPEKRVEKAWAFVRDEIRYLALEIGPASHRPSEPDAVLRRRFGDCKDKARLLATLLHGVGIESRVALVNTRIGRGLEQRVPTPVAFDHAIVRVEIGGRVRWIDPTIPSARGSFERIACPTYALALVLDPSTTDLVAIEPDRGDEPRMEIEEGFEASGFDKETRLVIQTTYRGAEADRIRARIAEVGKERMGKDFLNYSARVYPTIREALPLEIRDDERENVVVSLEKYDIPSFWRPGPVAGKLYATFEAPEIGAIASAPSTSVRTMPLAVPHPLHIRLHIRGTLPGKWGLSPSELSVRDSTMEFRYHCVFTGPQVDLDYAYDALRDSVAPEEVRNHAERLREIRGTTALTVSQVTESNSKTLEPEGSGKLNLGVLAFAAMACVLNGIGCVFLFRIRAKNPPPPWTGEPELVGIRGWLVLCAIGILVTPLTMAPKVFQLVLNSAGPGFDLLTTPGTEHYHPIAGPLILSEVFLNIAMFCVSVTGIPLFFGCRRIFPSLFIASRLGYNFYLVADHVLSRPLTDSQPDAGVAHLVGTTLATVIWVLYFWLSRRVRATFVR